MVRKFARFAVAALLCLGLAPGVATGASFSPGSAGIGDRYYPLDGNGGYNVRHYRLDVSYDPATDRLTGRATIEATAKQNLSRFNLDFVGLTVRSITVNGQNARWSRAGQELRITPKHRLRDGSRFTTVIRYRGVPATLEEFGLSGFIHTDDGAIVIGEPHVASSWFPANDHPRDRATFDFRITVPSGLEAVANGRLVSKTTNNGRTTWRWSAPETMATYLAFMAIGQFDIRSYTQAGIKYWDGIDSSLMEDRLAPITAAAGSQFLYSQIGEPAYKRLTRTVSVPPGGGTLTFQVNRDTEPGWDHLFVEARTAGGTDWTTLPDANGHTTQETGACPFFYLEINPVIEHYISFTVDDGGTPGDPNDDVFTCTPTGTTGAWHAASGTGEGWETWSIALPNTGATAKSTEVSITYASDQSVQGRGVAIDNIIVSSGAGTTSFEADGNVLDGWVAPIAGPPGSADNPNTWVVSTFVEGVPGLGPNVLKSLDRQPEIIAWEASLFGKYPFSTGGGVVDNAPVFFALENQTRPTYSPFFFVDPAGNDFVVVHELSHQWFGDDLTLDLWKYMWLNEGFATYTEWMWSEHEGFETPAQIFDAFSMIPADDPFWELAIGDPGTAQLFDFPVYGRGAMTLQALRTEIGDATFFKLLKEWVRGQKGGTVTTREFIRLAEKLSGKDLDPLFKEWLSSGKPAGLPEPPPEPPLTTQSSLSAQKLPAAVQSLAERLKDRPGNPFTSPAR
jgi:peptidase M1-like protein